MELCTIILKPLIASLHIYKDTSELPFTLFGLTVLEDTGVVVEAIAVDIFPKMFLMAMSLHKICKFEKQFTMLSSSSIILSCLEFEHNI